MLQFWGNIDVSVSGFGRKIVQAFALLGCCAAYVSIVQGGGKICPTFEGEVVQNKVLTLEHGINVLSRNVGDELATYAAQRPRTANTSSLFLWI
jgi:hypothetical protein